MWVKLDDRFWSNRKVRKAGNAIGVYVLALSWSADQLTDGRIPEDELDFICHSFADPHGDAETLEHAGLFVRDGDAWIIPDFLEYNDSADTIKKRRAKDRERKVKGGRASSARNPDGIQTESRRNPTGLRSDSGSPVPDPTRPLSTYVESQSLDTETVEPTNVTDHDHQLCEHLRDRIAQHTGNRLKIGKAWPTDMSKLRRLGPTELEGDNPKSPEEIRAAIDFLFDHLSTPKPDGFCWANVTQNPAKLRKNWLQLEQAYQQQTQPRQTTNTATQSIGVDMFFAMNEQEPAA